MLFTHIFNKKMDKLDDVIKKFKFHVDHNY
jgi:hypothetical protein